jgi:hypothetical protein
MGRLLRAVFRHPLAGRAAIASRAAGQRAHLRPERTVTVSLATLIAIDRWFSSSKTCSCCGVVKDHLARAKSGTRNLCECDACGVVCDRDVNAAINIAREASRVVAASSAVTVCREERSGVRRKPRVKRSSVKQKENTAVLPEAAKEYADSGD